ncbi:MAG: tetratricopeptide repeat protein, partial [Nitrospinae bacterium]|nr:tetratricopeptide repeat protein [Nitrospinota bacterium]
MADTTRICRYCGSGSVSVAQTPAPDGSITIVCARCKNSYVESPPPSSPPPQAVAPLKPQKTDAERNREADELLKEGLALADRKNFSQAVTMLRAAVDRSPSRVDILATLAGASSRANMQYEALAAWSKILEVEPENREALLKVGMLHLQRKRYDMGEAVLRKLIELDPGAEHAKLLLNIAKTQMQEDEKKAAPAQPEKARPSIILTIAGLIASADEKSKALASAWLVVPLVFVAIRFFAGPESAAAEWLLYAMLFYTVWLGVVVHEMGHGLAALWVGDDTALKSGRLTLNPLSHFSFIGSLVVPVIAWIGVGVAFGWAKSVPFDPLKMDRQPRGVAITAGAGPFASFAFSYLMFTAFMAFAVAHNGLYPDVYIRFTSDLSAPITAGGGVVFESLLFVGLELF